MAAKKKSRGPDAERIKIEGDWEAVVGRALTVERPAGGFPKPEPRYRPRKKRGGRRKPA